MSRFATLSVLVSIFVAPGVAFAHDPLVVAEPDDEELDDTELEAVDVEPMPGDGGPNVSTAANGKTPEQEFDEAYKLPDPAIGFGLSVSFGIDALTNRDEWNAELHRFGMPDLIDVGGEIGTRMSLFFEGFELAVDVGLVFDARDHGSPPATSLLGATAMAELSYDFLRSSMFTLGPSFGTGIFHSRICAVDDGVITAPDGAPPFQRVLDQPGEQACLGSNALLVRPGLVLGLAGMSPVAGNRTGFFMNLRPTYSFLVKGSQYSLEGSSLPEIDGPEPVHPGFGLDIEIGFVFGAGARASGF